MKIIGRKAEIAELRDAYDSGRPEFVAVYGRRRVGKTYLIKELFKKDFTFYFTGEANSTTQNQLRLFEEALSEYSSLSMNADGITGWHDAFRALQKLIEKSNRKRKVIFLDEMPWMDTPRAGFIKALEYFWNSWASSRPDVMLIVCGSAASWVIKKLLKNTGGLHNRVTRRMFIEPFTLGESKQYYQQNGFRITDEQIIEGYMIFGGIPYYLNLMRKQKGFVQNIDAICFKRGGALRDEFSQLYASLFNNSERHLLVVEALSNKASGMTRGEISAKTSISNSGWLTDTLNELELSGFIRVYKPFSRKIKGSVYQLIDPYTLFYYRFIKDSPDSEDHYWSKYRKSAKARTWSGYAFEQVCFAHTKQIKNALGIAGVIAHISSWRSESRLPGAQIDMVIDRDDGVISLCEIKYNIGEFSITKSVDRNLRNKEEAFAAETQTRKAVHTVMITPNGVVDGLYCDNIQGEVIGEDLFG